VISVKNVNKIIDCFPTALFAEQELLSVDENKIITDKIYKLQETFGAGNTEDWLSGKLSPDNCYRQSNIAEYLEFKFNISVSGITLLAMPEEILVIDITCLKIKPSISISLISLSSTNLITSLTL